MAAVVLAAAFVIFFVPTYVAWRRYLWAAKKVPDERADVCEYSLTDVCLANS